ncbi:NAD(P)/FAD-dependent oxidoreductase [Actinomycetospora chiangmaiensis]|uniref:NAD(P)/FAD-dependent oxidoreductase n=1 Tax=Actinomycetospora chiangmaiensis TaxID=402650 RepID=UPI00037A9AB3|nr:FAD-dependent oxidoreductase [Actinomycetospora chiangmaiensis]
MPQYPAQYPGVPDVPTQWSPTGRRPRTPTRLVALLGVLTGPALILGLWAAGLVGWWLAAGLAVVALGGGAALAGGTVLRSPGVLPGHPDTGDFVPGARVLVVGGGYVGLVAARALQARLGRSGDGRHRGRRRGPRDRASTPVGSITVVDPQPHMTYQPFLPEAAGGSIAPRHLTVSLRRVLDRCDVVTGSVVAIDDARRRAVVSLPDGLSKEIPYDVLVIAPGAVARELPVPGLAECAFTFRSVSDAAALRDQVLSRLDAAASVVPTTPAEAARRARLLTFVVVGGGFAGVEALGELEDLARRAGRQVGIDPDELRWVLVEAAKRIMPEVSEPTAARVHGRLARRGVEVRVGAGLVSAEGGVVRLADGTTVPTDTVVVAAGTRPHPLLERTDLPLERTGKVRCTAMLQVIGRTHVFAAGDGAAVPDLARGALLADENPQVLTAPTAQHAVRQARVLAGNVVAHLGGRPLQPYQHASAGVVAGLGRRRGVAEIRGVRLMGWPAYALHRAYHLWAMPTAERKARIVLDWVATALLGRDPVAAGAVAPSPRRGDGDPVAPVAPVASPVAACGEVPTTGAAAPAAPTPTVVDPAVIDGPTLREPHPSFPTPTPTPAPAGTGGPEVVRAPATGDQPALTWLTPGRHEFR